MKSEKEIQCAPCLRKNTQVRATQFCKTCNNSEPLCDVCSQHHTSQNGHENHELSEDYEECNSPEETGLAKTYFFWFSYILSFFSWLFSWLKSIGQQDTASKTFEEGHFIRYHFMFAMCLCDVCVGECETDLTLIALWFIYTGIFFI